MFEYVGICNAVATAVIITVAFFQHDPWLLSRCVVAWESEGETECFEVTDLNTKDTYIFKVDCTISYYVFKSWVGSENLWNLEQWLTVQQIIMLDKHLNLFEGIQFVSAAAAV